MLPVAGSAFCYILLRDSKLAPLREFGVFIGTSIFLACAFALLCFVPFLLMHERTIRPWIRRKCPKKLVGVLEPAELKPDWSDVAEKVMLAVNRPKPVLAGAGLAVAVALIVAVAVTASQPHPSLPEVFPPEHHREAGRPMMQSFAPSSLAEEEAPLTIRMCEPGRGLDSCVLHWCDLENTPSNNLTSWPASQAATCRCYSQSQTTASCTNISLSLVVSGPRPASLTQDVLHTQALSFVSAEYADANSVEITSATSRRLQSVVLEDWPSGTTQVDPLTQLPPINLGFATARRSSSSCEDAIYCYCSPKSCTTPSGYRRTVNDLTLPAPPESTLQPQGRPSLEVIVLFGISQQVDRSTLSGTFTAGFDSNFDPASPWSQRAMLRVCNELPSELNILSSNCWIQDFRNWLIGRGQKFPVDRFLDFHLTLKEFLVGHPSAASAMWLNEANNLTATTFTFQVIPTDGADATLAMRDLWLNYAVHLVSDFCQMDGPPEPHHLLKSQGLLHEWRPGVMSGSLYVEPDAVSIPSGKALSPTMRQQIGDGYLFLDWYAIPQITAREEGVNEDVTRTDAALAVQSIPAYVELANVFIALANPPLLPSGTFLMFNGEAGRAEWWCHLLSNKPDTSVIVVYSCREAEFMFPLSWQENKVSEGEFTVEADRRVVAKLGERALESKISFLSTAGPLSRYRYYLAQRPQLLCQRSEDFSLTEFLSHFRFPDRLEEAIQDTSSMSPVLCAVFAGDAKILRALLENRADANQKLYGLSDLGFYDGQTVLMAATKSRQTPKVLSTLIDLRADVNAATRIGLTAVALVRDPGQLRVLMEARADIHTPGRPFGLSPIAGAAVWACPETIAAMLAARCDPNFTPQGVGYGPLHAVCLQARNSRRATEIARILLASRADVNSTAAPVGVFKLVCWLSQARVAMRGFGHCSIVVRTAAALPGLTPLGAAALIGDEGLARLLWENDAEVLANQRGDLPEDLAIANGHDHLLPLLASFGV
ncbi:unnamed protein product [Symbiodinium microadriaticum]|nr:unnamed protein product [Symbiodinium microadriaticum]